MKSDLSRSRFDQQLRRTEIVIQRLSLVSAILLLPALIFIRVFEIYTRVNLNKPGSLFNNIESELFLVFIFLSIGAAYLNDAHVRVDILSARFSARVKAIAELLGAVFFVLPLTVIVLWFGFDMVWSAHADGETAAIALGAPVRWVILTAIPIGICLLALGVLVRTVRLLRSLSKGANGSRNKLRRSGEAS